MGVISGQIEMLASPFNAIKKNCYHITLLLAGRALARGIVYRERGRRRVNMRPPEKCFERDELPL
ncbi:hypothetical protein MES5069_450030 [Mesorhizobium escarrei]|uniref:Uncharacterized protein n=1 Tax=Mesorhizobium escarrei TaxID=666018 RepID=A0ABN8K468_9HYPH|nr:hypothetical protein MES5069_450030 [Mesorhizobium escarrei]